MGITFGKKSKYDYWFSKPRYSPPKYLAEIEVEELHDIAFHIQTKSEFRMVAQHKGFSKQQIDEYLYLFGRE